MRRQDLVGQKNGLWLQPQSFFRPTTLLHRHATPLWAFPLQLQRPFPGLGLPARATAPFFIPFI